MIEKNRLPKFPDSYIGENSREYDSSRWMERNQKKTTLLCLQYLSDPKLNHGGFRDKSENKTYLILDLGCGTGFSSEILAESGFRVIGIDILRDMLYKAHNKRKSISLYNNIFLILADIKHLPLRKNIIDHIISVSAYNFILDDYLEVENKLKILNTTAKSLSQLLKENGRIIIEFYPKNEKELEWFSSSFKANSFEGFIVKSKSKQKSGQYFLLLQKK